MLDRSLHGQLEINSCWGELNMYYTDPYVAPYLTFRNRES